MSFSALTPLRTAAAIVALALGTNAGIAVASTSSHGRDAGAAALVNNAHAGTVDKHPVRKAGHPKKSGAKVHAARAAAKRAAAKRAAAKRAAAKRAAAKRVAAAKAAAAKAAAAKAAAAKAAAAKAAAAGAAAVAVAVAKSAPQTVTTPIVTTPTTTAPTTTTTTTPTAPAAVVPVGIAGNWKVVLDSEFNTSSLNTNVWRSGWFGTGITDSPGDGGICNSSSNVTFPGDGSMHLNLTATSSTCQGGQTYPYTGSLVDSDPADGRSSGGFQYTYGVLEARVYVPGTGTSISNWPAIWADGQSWPNDGEDDLMEGLSGVICWHFHDPLGGPGGCDSAITPGWHTFASDWQPGSVTYYYDGQNVGSITSGITNAPMYIILSNGAPVGASNIKAASLQIQYVRVWQ